MGDTFSTVILVCKLQNDIAGWTVPVDCHVFQFASSVDLSMVSLDPLNLSYPQTTGYYNDLALFVAPKAGVYQTIVALKSGQVIYFRGPANSCTFAIWYNVDATSNPT